MEGRFVSSYTLLVVLCWIVSPAASQSYKSGSWWMQQPYGSNSFNADAEYLATVNLTCTDDSRPDDMDPQYWVLPDLTILGSGDTAEYYTLDGFATWEVSDNVEYIIITLLQEPQFGFYHCHLTNGVIEHVVKKSINYEGPYFGDLWAKYEMNVIIGLSAGGGMLLIIIVCYVVYRFRYEEPETGDPEDKKSYELPHSAMAFNIEDAKNGYPNEFSNSAYQPDDDQDASLEKLTEL